jgi:hypothetical protein
VRIGAPKDESLPPAELKALRRRFHRRKFLFPLLDQGPNNQFLQFRIALQKAHALNRTLVLPIWLPHNPKFLHFHPGAPATASRDKRLEQMWYPFEVAFDAPSLQLYVRIIPLATFRQLTAGKLERCLAHKGGFDVYLRLARLSCESFDELPEQGVAGASEVRERLAAAKDVRFLGFHQYDHELGTRDRHYEYLRWARPVMELASQFEAEIFNGSRYLAAHVRVPDAHWERNDCKHTINGQPAHSVSCGDPLRSINHTSMASEMVHALGTARRGDPEPLLDESCTLLVHSLGGSLHVMPYVLLTLQVMAADCPCRLPLVVTDDHRRPPRRVSSPCRPPYLLAGCAAASLHPPARAFRAFRRALRRALRARWAL